MRGEPFLGRELPRTLPIIDSPSLEVPAKKLKSEPYIAPRTQIYSRPFLQLGWDYYENAKCKKRLSISIVVLEEFTS